jgi:hypothetical protein
MKGRFVNKTAYVIGGSDGGHGYQTAPIEVGRLGNFAWRETKIFNTLTLTSGIVEEIPTSDLALKRMESPQFGLLFSDEMIGTIDCSKSNDEIAIAEYAFLEGELRLFANRIAELDDLGRIVRVRPAGASFWAPGIFETRRYDPKIAIIPPRLTGRQPTLLPAFQRP